MIWFWLDLRKISSWADIFSVGHSLADTIGLPGTGFWCLCIFGNKYNSGVYIYKCFHGAEFTLKAFTDFSLCA